MSLNIFIFLREVIGEEEKGKQGRRRKEVEENIRSKEGKRKNPQLLRNLYTLLADKIIY